jgi:hypothetical protein
LKICAKWAVYVPFDILSATQKSWRDLGSEANTSDEVRAIRTTQRKCEAIFSLPRNESHEEGTWLSKHLTIG